MRNNIVTSVVFVLLLIMVVLLMSIMPAAAAPIPPVSSGPVDCWFDAKMTGEVTRFTCISSAKTDTPVAVVKTTQTINGPIKKTVWQGICPALDGVSANLNGYGLDLMNASFKITLF